MKNSDDQNQLEAELAKLIGLGVQLHVLFHLEKCDYIPDKYAYLDGLPEDEFDDEDKATNRKYLEFLDQVEKTRESLKPLGDFGTAYQRFYTPAHRVVSAIAPERLNDFESQYKSTKRAKIDHSNYTIYDGIIGLANNYGSFKPSSALSRIQNQVDILRSLQSNLGSALFEIEQTLRMDLFDSEIESAQHLFSRGHLRASGAVAGVVLEEHLKTVSIRHGFTSRKQAPTISDFNEFLKKEQVIDTVMWRRIQGLADIRNLCDHAKDRDPDEEDLTDLLNGTKRVLTSVL